MQRTFSLYPSLVTEWLTLVNPAGTNVLATITNTVGATLCNQPVNASQTIIDAAMLPAGMYFVRLSRDGRLLQTLRFIKK